jgi:hypothetical protein
MRSTHLFAGFSLAALLCTTTVQAADPRLLNLVMPDATTLAGANVTSAEGTPFGQYVLTHLTSAMGSQLQTFVAATGFDPRKDVTEVLAASSGGATNPSGLILASGTFDVSQITAAIAAKAPTLTVQTYGGATLITGTASAKTAKANPGSIAFLGTNIAIAGDIASVKAAIDRSTVTNSINTALATQVQTLSTTEDAWVVSNVPASSLLSDAFGMDNHVGNSTKPATPSPLPMSQFAQMFNGIQGSSGGVKFGDTVVMTGQAVMTDAATAKSLADVLQALVSIASMAGGQNPEIASLAQILQSLKITADGATINLALSVPETQLESILNSMKNSAPVVKPSVKPASFVIQ